MQNLQLKPGENSLYGNPHAADSKSAPFLNLVQTLAFLLGIRIVLGITESRIMPLLLDH
jgi:hypothetical protein